MRSNLASLLEGAGFVSIVVGAVLLGPAAGLLILGGLLLAASYRLADQ